MTGPAATSQGEQAPIGRTLGIARPSGRRTALACLLGAGAIAADIGLMGCAAWLISRAAQHPNESVLALAIVGVQFFGLSRGFLRYEERLVGHDAAFRVLADLAGGWCTAGSSGWRRAGCRLSGEAISWPGWCATSTPSKT